MSPDQQYAQAMQDSLNLNQGIAGVNDQDYEMNQVLLQSIQE